ncbi:MAG: hypothetical protein IKG69_02905 [Atopobiaceae bacterium]|nr:hypothetical protein [Atopobiaceae bacterium]
MTDRYAECGIDDFAASLASLIGDVPDACGDGCEKAVRQSIRKTAKGLRSGEYGKSGRHEWSDEYMGGFSSAMVKGGLTPAGEVGNKAKPGLVHLIEKGHATLTGRRTAAFPHMAPAFDDMADEFVELAAKYVGDAL